MISGKRRGKSLFFFQIMMIIQHLTINLPTLIIGDSKIKIIKNFTKLDPSTKSTVDLYSSNINITELDKSFHNSRRSSIIKIKNFTDSYDPSDLFMIKFRLENFIPKGRLKFLSHRNIDLTGSVNGSGNVNLILGKHYACITPCVFNLDNIKETWRSFDTNLRLDFTENKTKPRGYTFKLNSIYTKARSVKDFSLAGSILTLSVSFSYFLMRKGKGDNSE